MLKRKALFPSTPKTPGLKKDWSNLPRRKCDNCGATYKPKRPLLEGQRGFCKDNCRKEYHKNGGAYRKVREIMAKIVERELKTCVDKRLREIVREEITVTLSIPPGRRIT
jgi:hypothetical protein